MTDFSFHGHDAAHDVLHEAKEIDRHVGHDSISTVFYIGSCCGYEAGLLDKHYRKATVFAVEAVRESYERFLCDDRSCCPLTVKTRCTAISHIDGESTIHMASMNTQHSLMPPQDWPVLSTRTAPCVTLDTFAAAEGVLPDLLVLDVEGAAGRVLVGAGHKILSTVKAVMCETEPCGANVFVDGDTDEFVDRLLTIYGLHRIMTAVPAPPVRQLNSVWVRK